MSWRFICVLLASLLCGFSQGCRRNTSDGHTRAYVAHDLVSLCNAIEVIEQGSKTRIPPTLESLITSFEKHNLLGPLKIEKGAREIKDRWGNVVIVVSVDGRIIGLGSSGPDGQWAYGRGDDIVVLLDGLE